MQIHQTLQRTWRALVQNVLVQLGTPTKLTHLYAAVARTAPEALSWEHWQAKVRQVLGTHSKVSRRSKRRV